MQTENQKKSVIFKEIFGVGKKIKKVVTRTVQNYQPSKSKKKQKNTKYRP
jgi:hypothetical protein